MIMASDWLLIVSSDNPPRGPASGELWLACTVGAATSDGHASTRTTARDDLRAGNAVRASCYAGTHAISLI